jgi:hypothetical protein
VKTWAGVPFVRVNNHSTSGYTLLSFPQADKGGTYFQELRTTFRKNYADLRFVGDFESAEKELIEQDPHFAFSSHDQAFYSAVTPAHIHEFSKLID